MFSQPQQQQNVFGGSGGASFMPNAGAAAGTSFSPFGQQQQQQQQQTAFGQFGASAFPAAAAAQNMPAANVFGAPTTPFASQQFTNSNAGFMTPSTGGGVFGAGGIGSMNSTQIGGMQSAFGQGSSSNLSAFGGSSNAGGFGLNAFNTGNAFGGGASNVGSVFGATAKGSRNVTYNPQKEIGNNNQSTGTLQAITCMPEFVKKSFEELRWEDEQAGSAINSTAVPFGRQTTSQQNTTMFGQTGNTFGGGFGANPMTTSSIFGQTQPNAFGGSGGNAFGSSGNVFGGTATTSSFGQPTSLTSGGLLGNTTAASTMFGQTQPGNTVLGSFGSTGTATSTGVFGQAPSNASFGSASLNTTGGFGAAPFGQSSLQPSFTFGSNSAQTTSGFGGFGAATAQSSSLFNQSTSSASNSNALPFGNTQSSAPFSFLNANNSNSIFNGSSSSAFGGSSNMFGSSGVSASNPFSFGAPSSGSTFSLGGGNTGSNLFGSGSGSSLFGSAASTSSAMPSMFSSFSGSSTSSSLFGTSNAFGSSFSMQPSSTGLSMTASTAPEGASLVATVDSDPFLSSFLVSSVTSVPRRAIGLSQSQAALSHNAAAASSSSLSSDSSAPRVARDFASVSLHPAIGFLPRSAVITMPNRLKSMQPTTYSFGNGVADRTNNFDAAVAVAGTSATSNAYANIIDLMVPKRKLALVPPPPEIREDKLLDDAKVSVHESALPSHGSSDGDAVSERSQFMTPSSKQRRSPKLVAVSEQELRRDDPLDAAFKSTHDYEFQNELKHQVDVSDVKSFYHLPKLSNTHIQLSPSLDELAKFTFKELLRVKDFQVIHSKYGNIKWPGYTDVVGIDIDKTIIFDFDADASVASVEVYPTGVPLPPEGQKLNKMAIVSLFCKPYPCDELNADDREVAFAKYEERLRQTSEDMGCLFRGYDRSKNLWSFEVDNFE